MKHAVLNYIIQVYYTNLLPSSLEHAERWGYSGILQSLSIVCLLSVYLIQNHTFTNIFPGTK